jgi:hypothetical protein
VLSKLVDQFKQVYHLEIRTCALRRALVTAEMGALQGDFEGVLTVVSMTVSAIQRSSLVDSGRVERGRSFLHPEDSQMRRMPVLQQNDYKTFGRTREQQKDSFANGSAVV